MSKPKLTVRFFRSAQGREQFGWPIGMPLVEKLEADLWEVRVKLPDGIARVLFTIHASEAVLLHGFVKKSQKIPKDELDTARRRRRQL